MPGGIYRSFTPLTSSRTGPAAAPTHHVGSERQGASSAGAGAFVQVLPMKPARLIVLFIAVAAGGIAALLAGRSDQSSPPAETPAPVAQLQTTEVLVAGTDIGMGNTVGQQDLRWQTWPAEAANGSANFIRKSERPEAIGQLTGSIARVPFSTGEPIREAKLIRANGSGYMAAILPGGMRAVSIDISPERGVSGFVLPNDHVDVILTRHDKEAEKNN